MNNNPLITIVTITFNLIKADRKKTFRQCVESVHNQTYKNIEHIIIDGASNDGTLDLIKEYANKGWVKYISEPDTGIYDAMNKGIEMANGEYIAFLNSDDFYHNNMGVELSVRALTKSNADFSYASVKFINKNGSLYEYSHPHKHPNIFNVFFTMPFCHQSMFTKKSVFKKENMFDSSFKSAGDYDFVLRVCLNNYKSIFVNSNFVTYRLGGLSDVDQENSIKEVSRLFYKNYKKFCNVSEKDCNNIYCNFYNNFPESITKELIRNNIYFNKINYFKNKIFFKFFMIYKELLVYFKKIFLKISFIKINKLFIKDKIFSFYRGLPLPIKKIYRFLKK